MSYSSFLFFSYVRGAGAPPLDSVEEIFYVQVLEMILWDMENMHFFLNCSNEFLVYVH